MTLVVSNSIVIDSNHGGGSIYAIAIDVTGAFRAFALQLVFAGEKRRGAGLWSDIIGSISRKPLGYMPAVDISNTNQYIAARRRK